MWRGLGMSVYIVVEIMVVHGFAVCGIQLQTIMSAKGLYLW